MEKEKQEKAKKKSSPEFEAYKKRLEDLEKRFKRLEAKVSEAGEGRDIIPESPPIRTPTLEIPVQPSTVPTAPSKEFPEITLKEKSKVQAPPIRIGQNVPEQVRKQWLQLERAIGERWLVWVGALVFSAGFGIFLKYAFEQGWLNEFARISLGFLVGLSFIGFSGFLYRKKFQALAQGISALGLIILYLTIFTGYHFYNILPATASFLLFFATTIGGMSIAISRNAFPTASLSILGAFATPTLLVDPTSTMYYEPKLFSYLLIINLGVLYISSIKRWRTLSFLSFLGTIFYFGSWYLFQYTPSDFSLAVGFATTYFIVFSFVSTFYSVIWKKKSNLEDILLVVFNPAIFFLIGYKMLIDRGTTNISPYIPLSMAVYHLILATIIREINAKDIFLYFGLIGTAIGLLTLPIPMTVKSYWITVAWGAEAVTLIVAGSILNRKPLRIGGLTVFLLVIFRLFPVDSFTLYHGTDHYLLFLNLKFLALLSSTLTFGLGALSFSRFKNITSEERTYVGPLWTIFGVTLFWITNLELFSCFSHVVGIAGKMKWAYSTMLWSAFLLWLLLHGILKRVQILRVVGLGLMGAIATKILLVDTLALYNYYRYGYLFLLNWKFLSQAIFLGSIFASAFLYGRRLKEGIQFEEKALGLLWGTFTGMLFLSLNLEVFSYFSHIREIEIRMMKFIFTTMLWTGFSFGLLLSGIIRKDYKLRMAGIFLIGATAVKFFFIDTPLLYDYSYGRLFILNLKFLSLSFLLTAIATSARFYVRKEIKLEKEEKIAVPLLWGLFISLLFLGLNVEIISYLGHFEPISIRMMSFIYTTILWSIFSFSLIFFGIRDNLTPLRIAGLSLATVTFIKLAVIDTIFLYNYTYGLPFLINLKFASVVVLLFTLAYTAMLYIERDIKRINFEEKAVPYLWSLFLILLFIELNSQASLSLRIWDMGAQRTAFAISLLWVLYGFGLLLTGIIKKMLPLRISALSLFGITLLKVFFVDLRFTGKLYKMFILLGIGSILLTAAYFYRRYRKRLEGGN